MSSITARTLLDAWDLAADLPAARRAVTLIRALLPAVSEEELLDLSVGACNVALLRIRAALFGRVLYATCNCGTCGERLEFSAKCDELVGAATCEVSAGPIEIVAAGYSVRFRLPTQRDIEAVATLSDADQARATLWARCVLAASDDAGAERDVHALPPEVVHAVSEEIARADPCVELLFTLSCPTCSNSMSSRLDIAGFLWTELDAMARRLLCEIDALAHRYHWSESAILELSPRRRYAYLQMGAA
jgi:hypothetical protein